VRRAAFALALVSTTALVLVSVVNTMAWTTSTQRGREVLSPPLTPLKLPSPVRRVLPNGVTLVFLEDRRAPLVTFGIFVRNAGPHHDPAIAPGIAAAIQATLRESASESIAALVQQRGGEIRLNGREGHAAFTGSSLTGGFPALLEVASDMVTQGDIPRAIFDAQYARSRARTAGTIRDPASGRLAAMIFQDSPNGTSDSAFELALQFRRERFLPGETLVGITGDLSLNDALSAVERGFGSWRPVAERTKIAVPAVTEPAPRALILPAQGAAQTRYTIGAMACARTDPDFYPMEVLNEIIGRRGSGRMFTRLREQKGYAYDPHSVLSTALHRPLWAALLAVRTDISKVALRDFFAELDSIRTELVPEAELQAKKRALIAGLPVRLESPLSTLETHVQLALEGLGANYWEEYLQGIARVTSEDVRRVATKYLEMKRLSIVAVGDPLILEPILRELGLPVTRDLITK